MQGATPEAGRQAGFLQGISLLFPITLSVMGALFVAPVAPRMIESFTDGNPDKIGQVAPLVELIITIPSLCVALFSPFAGALGDRLGRRRLLMLSMAIYIVLGVAPYALDDLRAILATRVLLGVVEAMLMTLSTTLIGDFFQGNARNRWLAAQTGTASLSAIVVIMVAGAVGQSDWHKVFLLYLIPALFLTMVALFTWEPAQSSHLRDPGRHMGWSDLPWRSFGPICLITLFGSVMFYAVQIKLPSGLQELGVVLPGGDYDAARGAGLTALASLFVPVGTVCFWIISPRSGLRTQFLVEFSIMGAGFVAMGHAHDPLSFALWAGVNQIGAGMLLPTLLTCAVHSLPFELRGRGSGLWGATFALGQFACNNLAVPLASLVAGTMIARFQLFGFLCLGAACLALVACLTLRRD
ncbi:MFS transporter [Novosphingobium rosa]|uniref:MFS transporter n=1 Tax=Novosphingobium rosa TaxID=76978 RepID=UPI00082A76D7|nr:MFS transporter [Novosphingobium rosa]